MYICLYILRNPGSKQTNLTNDLPLLIQYYKIQMPVKC